MSGPRARDAGGTPGNTAPRATRRGVAREGGAWVRALAVARFELHWQRHDVMTLVYAGVLFGLPFAFTGTTAVDLVGERGAVPRTAAWSLAHALAGVTAFGQLITTFVAAGAALRDDLLRTRALVATTRVTRREYLGGRLAGAALTLALLYLALPLGAWLGGLLPSAPDGRVPPLHVLAPWGVLVLPNALFLATLFFAAGALAGSLAAILLLGVALVALWQAGVALAADPATAWAGALLDPFGNGALTVVTHGWTAAERTARAVPWDAAPLVANRALWLVATVLVAAWTLARWDFRRGSAGARPTRSNAVRVPSAAVASAVDVSPHPDPHVRADRPATRDRATRVRRRPRPLAQVAELTRFTVRDVAGDRTYLALAGLAALNAAFGAWRAAGAAVPAGTTPTAHVLGYVATHGRVFSILLAAVFAGELVWRERDLRADALRDTLPLRTGRVVAAKLVGLVAALLPLVVALVVAGGAMARARGVAWDWTAGAAWALGDAWPALARLALLAVALHAVVQHKVAGHFALVALWLAAVSLGAALGLPAMTWLDPLPVGASLPPAGTLAVAAAAAGVAWRGWRHGVHRAAAGGGSRRPPASAGPSAVGRGVGTPRAEAPPGAPSP